MEPLGGSTHDAYMLQLNTPDSLPKYSHSGAIGLLTDCIIESWQGKDQLMSHLTA